MKSEGYSVLELLMVVSVSIVISGAAIPLANNGVDRTRAAGAVRYVAGRMASARFEAVRRSAYVAIQFVQHGDGFWLRTYVDGNRNGVLSGECSSASFRDSSEDMNANAPERGAFGKHNQCGFCQFRCFCRNAYVPLPLIV